MTGQTETKSKGLTHRQGMLLLFLVTFIWGAGYLGVQGALDAGIKTEAIMAARFLLGALLVFVCAGGRIRRGPSLTHGVLGGMLMYGGFHFQTVGQTMTTIAGTAFLTATYVVMIPFVLMAAQRKAPPVYVFAASLCTLLGVALISFQPGEGLVMNRGSLMVLLGALFFALHMVYLGFSVMRYDAPSLTFWQLTAAGALGCALMAAGGHIPTPGQLQSGLLPLLYSGFLATGLCYFLESKAQKVISPAQTGVVLSLDGVVASVLSILLGMEPFRWQVAAGGVAITAAVVFMEMKHEREPGAACHGEK